MFCDNCWFDRGVCHRISAICDNCIRYLGVCHGIHDSVTITGSAVLFVTESDCFVTIATGSFGENDKSPPGIGARRGFMFLGRVGVTCF